MLGNATDRAGKGTYEWNGTSFTRGEAANAFLRTSYRRGWELSNVV